MGPLSYALQVIEGKKRGQVYDLPLNSELYLGRGANFDIVIDEDMVSRRHARILTFHDRVVLQDLNSTNGTSVNQQRIQGVHHLQLGDVLTIGTCVLEVVPSPGPGISPMQPSFSSGSNQGHLGSSVGSSTIGMHADGSSSENFSNSYPDQRGGINSYAGGAPPAPPVIPIASQQGYGSFTTSPSLGGSQPNQGYQQAHLPQGNSGNFNGMASISGARPRMKSEVGNFPSTEAADVLTLVERLIERRHDGVLALFDPEEREGSIYFRGGRIFFSTYEDPHRIMDVPINPHQCLVKLCCWPQGRFKVKSMNALPSFEQEIHEDSRSLIEQVRHNCNEMIQLRAQLPPLNMPIAICKPLNPLLTALTPEQLYLFQLALNNYDVRSIIECHPQGEREGIKSLLFLLEQAYLKS